MFSWFWKPAGKFRHVSHDGAWMLHRDGAWRLTLIETGAVFTYDDYTELMFDLLEFGQSWAVSFVMPMVSDRRWLVAL